MVKVFDESEIATSTFGRNGSRISTIKAALKEKHLKKPGDCCLLNSVVLEFSEEHKSDPGLHSQLRNSLDKSSDFKVLRKDDRLVVVRVA